MDILTGQFSHNIDRIWGVNELLVASRKDYVKYTDKYYTRSHVSFDEGVITIESQTSLARLKNAIVHTLLMGSDANGIDLLLMAMYLSAPAHSFLGKLLTIKVPIFRMLPLPLILLII